MQLSAFMSEFNRFLKISLLIILISVSSCSFNLESAELPKRISCRSNKCCYDIMQANEVQICGSGTIESPQFYIKNNY